MSIKILSLSGAERFSSVMINPVRVLHLIGWDAGKSFLDQSQSKAQQNQFNCGLSGSVIFK